MAISSTIDQYCYDEEATCRRGGDGLGNKCKFCLSGFSKVTGKKSEAYLDCLGNDGNPYRSRVLEESETLRLLWVNFGFCLCQFDLDS